MGVPPSSIGHYMVGVGAGIFDQKKKTVLMLHRASEFQKGVWEIVYGRLNQGEGFLDALVREVQEETQLTSITIGCPIRTWHLYRGTKDAAHELVGVTYFCTAPEQPIQLSDEHDAYRWMSEADVRACITNDSIREDVLALFTYASYGKNDK